jgi:hypothetical protein
LQTVGFVKHNRTALPGFTLAAARFPAPASLASRDLADAQPGDLLLYANKSLPADPAAEWRPAPENPAFRGSAVVGYAAFKKHCSFFPMSLGIIADFAEELRQYQTSKGTLQFPPEKPLPPPLIGRMVHARVAEIDRKKNRP